MRTRLTPIGLEVSGDSFTAAQVDRRSGSLRASVRLDRAGASLVPTWEELERLSGVLDRQGFEGRRVVVSVPDADLLTATLELPPAESGAPVEQIGRAEFARLHKREAGSLELAMWPAGAAGRSGQMWLAVGCEHSRANALLDVLEAAGMRTVGLDARSAALARVLGGVVPGDAGLWLLVDAGHDGALTVVLQGGQMVYQRFTPECGLAGVRKASEGTLGPEGAREAMYRVGLEPDRRGETAATAALREQAGALGRDIGAAMAYAAHRHQSEVRGVWMSGPGAVVPGLARRVGELVGVEIRTLAPGASLGAATNSGGADPALATAIGLALYPMELAA